MASKMSFVAYHQVELSEKDIAVIEEVLNASKTVDQVCWGFIKNCHNKGYGFKLEGTSEGMKAICYNLNDIYGGNKQMFLSAEAETPTAAVVVLMHKLTSILKWEIPLGDSGGLKGKYR